MKSPWNLLSKLTFRRRPEEPEVASVDFAGEPEAAKKETLRVQLVIGNAQPAPALDEIPHTDLLATTAIPVGGSDVSPGVLPITVEEIHESAVLENLPSSDETVVSDDRPSGPTRSPRSPRAKSEGISKKDEPAAVPQFEVASNEDDVVVTPTLMAGPAFDAVTLDEEIKKLRQQLAEKLRMQNDQLRKMIQRFDR